MIGNISLEFTACYRGLIVTWVCRRIKMRDYHLENYRMKNPVLHTKIKVTQYILLYDPR